MLHKLVCKFVI